MVPCGLYMTRSGNEKELHHNFPLQDISLSFDLHIVEIREDYPIGNTLYHGEIFFFVGTLDWVVVL